MKPMKRLLALLLAGAMTLSLTACGDAGADPSGGVSAYPDAYPDASGGVSAGPDASADPSASPEIVADLSQGVLEFSAGMSAGDVLLTVNGADIPADLFLYMLAMNCMNMQPYMAYFGMTMEDIAPTLLDETVTLAAYHELMRQKAAELGCLPTDAQQEEIRAALEEADMDTIRLNWGFTDDSASYVFSLNTYYNNVLDAATHDPSPEELEEYIIAQGVYRVKHILLKTVDDSRQPLSDEEIAQKRTQAEDLLAQLQGAEDLPALFDQLMNELSEDGRDENGALYAPEGYLASPGQMVAEFEEAGKALKAGELSGIVETTYGYHILLGLPLAPFTDDETADYAENYRPNVLEDLIDQWLAEADIVRTPALEGLDAAEFYNRLAAYQQALADETPDEGDPVESGGVG